MKLNIAKRMMIFVLLTALLSGCSVIDGINNSLNYVDQAMNYINNTAQFANEIRVLAQQAASDPEARKALKQELEIMKDNIIQFNGLEAPAIAKDIHQQLVSYNETLLKEINSYLEKFNEQFNVETILDSEIFKTIDNITQILRQLEQLGN